MKAMRYQSIDSDSKAFWIFVAGLALVLLAGLGAASYMEHEGHWVTGMTNSIVWGIPHVFAIFLIVAASGALNVASVSSVFGKTAYKPLARLSGLLAVALLVGGLMVLVLDLGRPDRLIEAMTYYNFKSIFAWNIFLYIIWVNVYFIGISRIFSIFFNWNRVLFRDGTQGCHPIDRRGHTRIRHFRHCCQRPRPDLPPNVKKSLI